MTEGGGASATARERATALVLAWLDEAGVEHEPGARTGEVVVRLPGEHRLTTTASLLVGDRSLSLSAFVVRRPEEATEQVMRWLLRRNARLRGVAFALDGEGDVYLVARLPLAAVVPDVLDELLGTVLATADGAFDELLRLGFAGSIRREARWRAERGLDARNLAAFSSLLRDDAEGRDRHDAD
ncbi:YbjN domain-containing protein [Aquipuribacter sp. SD81]|uniref:YbjN domain-containing protein n=1 Tax=Aquipuribacter sp. SD81 TaxID=3127703 RepID=UPI00301ADCB6